MRSSTVTDKFRSLSFLAVIGGAVTLFHSAAFAQQDQGGKDAEKPASDKPPAATGQAPAAPTPAPATPTEPGAKTDAPQDLPPEYGPPPGYRRPPAPPNQPPPPPSQPPAYYDYYYGPPGYPPPRYHYRRPYGPPPPVRYYPEPASYRSFFFGVGLGVGGIGVMPDDPGYENSSRAGLGYTLRFGFGVSPRWSIVFAADGAHAYFDGIGVSQTAWTIGPQVFLTRQLYARVGTGAATYEQDACDDMGYCAGAVSDSGTAGTAALGFEFMQSYHASLALEAVGTMATYPDDDRVSTFRVNFVLNLF